MSSETSAAERGRQYDAETDALLGQAVQCAQARNPRRPIRDVIAAIDGIGREDIEQMVRGRGPVKLLRSDTVGPISDIVKFECPSMCRSEASKSAAA